MQLGPQPGSSGISGLSGGRPFYFNERPTSTSFLAMQTSILFTFWRRHRPKVRANEFLNRRMGEEKRELAARFLLRKESG